MSDAQLRRDNYAVGNFGEFVGQDGPLAQLPDEIANLSVQEGIRRLREGPGAGPHWVLPSGHMAQGRGGPSVARGYGAFDWTARVGYSRRAVCRAA